MAEALAEKQGTDVAAYDEKALAAGAIAGIDQEDLVLPVIKITQQLSREVTDGNAESGHFINSVTGEDYGDSLDFVIVGYNKGRFLVHNRDEDDEKTYVASGPIAPDSWPPEYAGKAFADIPDAEEQWKARANDPEDPHEWGRGPVIVTTHNYVGFSTSDPGMPARIGLSRTSAPAAKKINTLLKFSQRAPWASAVTIYLVGDAKGGKPYYVAKAKQGPQSDADTVESAKALAHQVQEAGAFALDGSEVEEADKAGTAKPKAPAGGVSV